MTDLVPCPLCGGSELKECWAGEVYRYIVICRCRHSTSLDAWNSAGAYAEGLRREVKRLCELCTSVHDRLLRGDSDSELLAMLEEAWKGGSDGR